MLAMFEYSRDTGIRVGPVPEHPGMFRAYWPDGSVSPMGNIARVKEAARMSLNAKHAYWKPVAEEPAQ